VPCQWRRNGTRQTGTVLLRIVPALAVPRCVPHKAKRTWELSKDQQKLLILSYLAKNIGIQKTMSRTIISRAGG